MTENALVIRDEMSLQDTMSLGQTLAKSGYFDDAKDAAKAVVKILAGRELGFGPIASMTGISVIKGKVAVGANLMAAAVKGDPRYDYRVIEMTAERCDLVFFERGVEVGHSTFTIEEARAAGVGSAKPPGKPNTMLNMFPRNMLFARAMSNGMRWYCPNATGGSPVYTPEELGATVDGEGEVVTVPSRVVQPPRDANQAIAEAYGTEHAADVAEAQRDIADLEPERKGWPSGIVSAIVDAHLAANTPNTLGMLNLSKVLQPSDSKERIMTWATLYRSARAEMESKDAASTADTELVKQETAETA